MIEHTLNTAEAILQIHPQSSLEASDFEELARAVDPFISETGGLAGLIIEAPAFPGWKSLGAMIAHLRFVRDHHKHIKKIIHSFAVKINGITALADSIEPAT